jgi:saccharopine dehydrogenase (NAD+, L-lysine-forming)
MSRPIRIVVRHETRATERRAPITPADAALLCQRGISVAVEESPQRVFPVADYLAAGCTAAAAGSWVHAPADTYILGLKELPEHPPALRHRHIFFGHAYKGQREGVNLLRRFDRGGGTLLDLEYLVDAAGRRLVAFGYWAGYVGAALAVLAHRGRLATPLQPMSKQDLDLALRQPVEGQPSALIIGALGRCGHGARDAFATAGITPTCWDLAETAELNREALLSHEILVNTVLATRAIPPFLTRTDLRRPDRRLAMIADVSCDVASDRNVLPIYDACTSWQQPVRQLPGTTWPAALIAIDNLPSLLPKESSVAFSAELTPFLLTLGHSDPVWSRCQRAFHTASATVLSGDLEPAHV